MKKLFIIAMACYGFSARAQLRESKDFLYLYSDSIIYARDIKIRPDFSGNLRVRVDSRNVPIAQVKFLNSKDGFFANTRKIGIIRTAGFAERIIEGRINVFQDRTLSYTPFVYDAHHTNEMHYPSGAAPSVSANLYYNTGYADLKMLNYVNLKKDMADNPQSMDMLYAYRRSMNTTKFLYIAGAASILAAGLTSMGGGESAYSTSRFTTGVSLGALGLGLIAGGYLKSVAAKGKLETAVDIYNR
ncbi:hypothetical protein FBD94_17740 [Pedobacter hiemivivus]|uniref:Uncharacterized protein n=1 Tax=Pedobacter hiemivivus TaxID=2530454 RepID=A0A4U1G6I6_9SPHI|nr:hypothetical protein [Pedobacter hiemivivus]TKC58469.1 hypothetical protein FBD94_17740 [Pedobacter hiemivivus]